MKIIDAFKLKNLIVDKCNPINKYELLQLIDELSEEIEQPTPLKVAIKWNWTVEYGERIIDCFGVPTGYSCITDLYFYLDEKNNLMASEQLPEGYTEIILKEEEKEETYTCRCGKELTIPNCECQFTNDIHLKCVLNQVIESFSKFGGDSDDVGSNFNIISHEVKAEYLCHRVNALETDNAALCKELTELKLKLKDLSK